MKTIDWSNEDFTKIDFSKVIKNKQNSFKRAIVLQMDRWLVQGFNERPIESTGGVKFVKFIEPAPPKVINDDYRKVGLYNKQINRVFNNVYSEFKDSGVDVVKSFCKWYGYRYYDLFNDISWFKVADGKLVNELSNKKGVKAGWHYICSENDTFRRIFFEIYRSEIVTSVNCSK
ncbi:hypothetical protein N9043_00770 [bacterium]|nr:hypothetical protein [bacterium]